MLVVYKALYFSSEINIIPTIVMIVGAAINTIFHLLCAAHWATCVMYLISCYLIIKESALLDIIFVFFMSMRFTEALLLAQGRSARLGMEVHAETHFITFPITFICKR